MECSPIQHFNLDDSSQWTASDPGLLSASAASNATQIHIYCVEMQEKHLEHLKHVLDSMKVPEQVWLSLPCGNDLAIMGMLSSFFQNHAATLMDVVAHVPSAAIFSCLQALHYLKRLCLVVDHSTGPFDIDRDIDGDITWDSEWGQLHSFALVCRPYVACTYLKRMVFYATPLISAVHFEGPGEIQGISDWLWVHRFDPIRALVLRNIFDYCVLVPTMIYLEEIGMDLVVGINTIYYSPLPALRHVVLYTDPISNTIDDSGYSVFLCMVSINIKYAAFLVRHYMPDLQKITIDGVERRKLQSFTRSSERNVWISCISLVLRSLKVRVVDSSGLELFPQEKTISST